MATPPTVERGDARVAWLALALVLLGTVWLYLPALRTEFFADDFLFLDQVRDRSLWDAIRTPDPLSNFFRPVSRQVYFWVVAGLTNESPVAFRVGNLAMMLVALVLLFAIARRFAGAYGGVIAAGFLALHYAVDVPVRWACGSQETFAVTGALAALLLHLQGRRGWASVMLVIAALSKEVILLTPFIAVFADRRARESWWSAARRAWPLGAAVLVWALVFVSMPQRRVAQGTEVEFDLVASPLAALAHLVQVALGAEWRQGELGQSPTVWPPLVPLVLVLAAIVWTGLRARGGRRASDEIAPPPARAVEVSAQTMGKSKAGAVAPRAPRHRTPAGYLRLGVGPTAMPPLARHGVATGIVWALLATLPVVAVALLWSAYYYLFAMCGVALALGSWLAYRPLPLAALVVALLAWGSASARDLGEFSVARDPWAAQSHINRHYIDRSNRIVDGYLASLRRAHPKLPTGSTLFFAGLKGNVAFQRGDGPLLRWAYRDSSIRSYYLNAFSREKLRPGPLLVFVAAADTLQEMDYGNDLFLRLAFGMLVSDQPKSARDALGVSIEREGDTPRARTWRAWAAFAAGDSAAALADLEAAGARWEPGAIDAERERVLGRFAAGDTAGAIATMRELTRRHALDPGAHGLLADLLLVRDRRDPDGAVEALAARVLAPNDPYVWRRWAMVQTDRERYLEALGSFERYFALGGPAASQDAEAQQWATQIRAALPGGDLAPEELRE